MKGYDKVFTPGLGRIFVFGSNLAGIHGAGAAKTAFDLYGARWGQAEGIQGNSYAIPTKDDNVVETLSLPVIKVYVETFRRFTIDNPLLYFFVTRLGCGLAGYTDDDMGPLFKDCPRNVELPYGWG
jgi:hypothetical protein